MQRRRTEMPGVYVPGTWKTTDMMERAAKYVAENCPLRVLADPCATLSANDLHRQEHHGSIAVGTSIAERPPLRSVRAGFPHTAPTSGVSRGSGQTATDGRCGEGAALR